MGSYRTKEQMAHDSIMSRKLWALRQIGVHCGWIGEPLTDETAKDRFESAKHLIIPAILVLEDPSATVFQKSACAMLLDYALHGWRDIAPPGLLGHIIERNSPEVRDWRNKVLERDGYSCTKCGRTDDLHAHHINHWIDNPHLRIVVGNGVTLCVHCHRRAHGSMFQG